MPNLIDRTGKRYGRVVVLLRAATRKDGYLRWVCKCDCGNTTEILSGKLDGRSNRSCGCWERKTHGMRHTRAWRAWNNMKGRCNSKDNQYYSGRGISICERWLNSFENFFADMGHPPEGLWLDRINNDGNYEKDNCRWATPLVQSRNKRKWWEKENFK